MTRTTYHVVKLRPADEIDLASFECGEPVYDEWLATHALASIRAGVCAVYLLLEQVGEHRRVVGYYAISPAQVLRSEAPSGMNRGWPRTVPAWRLGKLAIHVDLRRDRTEQWGRQLLRHALETIVKVADSGGGKVIVVDADNAGLIDFYTRNGFRLTGQPEGLTLFLKVSTARKSLSNG